MDGSATVIARAGALRRNSGQALPVLGKPALHRHHQAGLVAERKGQIRAAHQRHGAIGDLLDALLGIGIIQHVADLVQVHQLLLHDADANLRGQHARSRCRRCARA